MPLEKRYTPQAPLMGSNLVESEIRSGEKITLAPKSGDVGIAQKIEPPRQIGRAQSLQDLEILWRGQGNAEKGTLPGSIRSQQVAKRQDTLSQRGPLKNGADFSLATFFSQR